MKIGAQRPGSINKSTKTGFSFKFRCCCNTDDSPPISKKRSPGSSMEESSLSERNTQAPGQGQGSSDAPPAPEAPAPAPPAPAPEAPAMSPEKQLSDSVNAILIQAPGSPTLDRCTPEHQSYIIQHGMDMLSRGDGLDSVAQACAQMATLCQSNHIVALKLSQCTPEHQSYIIQHGMDMLSRGDNLRSVSATCRQMAILIQAGDLGPLGQCTLDQQSCIIRYGMDMLARKYNPEFVDQVCGSMATLIQDGKLGPLEQCTLEQQGYIIRHGMDMIKDGYEPLFAAQVCGHMATLIQAGDFGPLEQCTPDQQDCIKRYGENMLSSRHSPEFVAQVCASMIALIQAGDLGPLAGCATEHQSYIIQHGMDMITCGDDLRSVSAACRQMAILIQARDLGPLEQCTPDQQAYIIQYGMDMICDGNKPEWAAQVCASMAILYQSGIEAFIPDQIIIEANQSVEALQQHIDAKSGTVFDLQFITQRATATQYLRTIMTANGADYDIISNYLKKQRQSSWDDECLIMKYFLLQQRTNGEEEARSIYYFEGDNRNERADRQNIRLSSLQGAYAGRFIPSGHLDEIRLNQYAQTVAMYKAYTAIALKKTQFNEKNSAQRTCQLQRAMVREKLIESYQQAYASVKKDETFTGMKGGIADSTALGTPVYHFTKPEQGCDIHEMQVPFFRIHAAYFISPELCYDDVPKKKCNFKKGYGGGHEFVCDLGKLPIKLIILAQLPVPRPASRP